MADILDYLSWRGDLTLAASPFNEVDNLILAELSFVPLAGYVPPLGAGESVPLWQAAERYFAHNPPHAIDMGILVPDRIPDLFWAMSQSVRFRDIGLSCFSEHLDLERAIQFAALTAELSDGTLYLSFRGTDDTLAGWKEDFAMSFTDTVPAQREALDYVHAVAAQYRRRRLRLGGHSKGGNLAVYGGVHCRPAVQKRIVQIYSNDGPGFRVSLLDTPEHGRVAERIVSIVPESSVVGMLMEHEEDYFVVRSNQIGLLQHDGFSWEVLGPSFVHLPPDSPAIRRQDKAMKDLVASMNDTQRRHFTEGLFDILSSTNASTLKELADDGFKAARAMLRAMADLDAETRTALGDMLKLVFQTQVRAIAEEWKESDSRKHMGKKKKKQGP